MQVFAWEGSLRNVCSCTFFRTFRVGTLSVGCFRFELLLGISRLGTCASDLRLGICVWKLPPRRSSFCLRTFVWPFTLMGMYRRIVSRLRVFAWELQFGNYRLRRCPWKLSIRVFILKLSLGIFAWKCSFGWFRLRDFPWELSLGRSLLILRWGAFLWELSLRNVRLGTFASELSFWNLRLVTYSYELSLGKFALGKQLARTTDNSLSTLSENPSS